ncbi:TPA: hypothetical protein DCQ44_01235 [Candidatus Taylorbacteria bacterium]|nr:hypothetical protein [Candidatus Taylorbacteria bacterium]
MKRSRALALKISSVSIIAILILGYGLFQARNLILGPEISLTTPKNGENVTNPLIVVSGVATNITHISLNDRQIFVDNQGKFSEKLLVPPGYTIIKLAAQDKFGRTTQRLIELNYTAPLQVVTATSSATTSVDTLSGTSTATNTVNIIQ